MRILFIAHRLPYAPNRGDRIRAYHLLREMARWADVDVCALVHDDEEASHTGDLLGFVKSVTVARVPRRRNWLRAALALPSSTPLTHALLETPELGAAIDGIAARTRPDAVLCFCTGVGPLALRPSLARVPMLLDMGDVDSAKWRSLSGKSVLPMSWIYAREARCLARFEAEISRKAAVTTLVTEAERQELLWIAPDVNARAIGNGVDIEYFRPPAPNDRTGPPTVVFCGMMDYAPNVEGIQWFVRQVWPLLRVRTPDIRLTVVGARPVPAVRALASSSNGVEVTGAVPDVRPFLWNASASIAPLLTARGVQTKVLESTAAGLPTVVTPEVSKGLPRALEGHELVASEPEDFADAVMAAITGTRGRTMSEEMSWEAQLRPLKPLLESVVREKSPIGGAS